MKVHPTPLAGVLLIEPQVHRDDRGFFLETYHQQRYADNGIEVTFVQDNHSRSSRGTVRGLHAQLRTPQGKLMRAIEGEIWDVAVDIRPDSPTYRSWYATTLSADNFRQLYIPEGCAHGFCVLTESAQVEYKCTALYDPSDQLAIAWNDPDIGIDWPVEEPLLSAKDQVAPTLAAIESRLRSGA